MAISHPPNSDNKLHCLNSGSTGFSAKIFHLLEQSQYTSLISWIEDGAAFRIHDPTRFSEELLPQYFKHRNWSSFIRQLNMYQFQKVSPKGSYKQRRASQPHACDFRHPDFHRDHKEWLPNIKRKTPRNRSIFQYAATMVDPPPPQDDGDEDEIPGPHPGSVPHLRQQPDPPSQASPPLHPSANVAMLLDRFSSRMTSLTLRVEDVERDLFEVRGIMEQQEHQLGHAVSIMTSIIQRDLGYDVGNSADGSDRGGGVGPYSCSSAGTTASMMYQDRIQGRQGYMQGESTIEQWRHERGVLGSTRRIWIPETVAALNHGGKDPQETMVGKSSSNIATGSRSDIYHKWSAGNMPSGTLDVRPDLENIRSGRIGDIVRLNPSCDEISDGGEHGAQDLPFPPPSPPRASLLSPPHHASSVPPLLAPSALFGGFHHSQQQDLAVSRYRPDYRPECENNEDQTRSVHGMMAGLEHVVNHYHQATTMVSPATLALGSAASAPSLASAERPKAAIRMLASMSTSAENMPSGSGTSLSAMQDGEVPSTTSTSSVASTSAAESSRCVP